MSEDAAHFETLGYRASSRMLPTVLRSGESVQILIAASVAESLFEAISKSGLRVTPPAPVDCGALAAEFGVEPKNGEIGLIASDPEHCIADIIVRWRSRPV